MSSIVLIANGAAYGHESLFNALRLAIAMKEQQSSLDLRLFLMSDAVVAGWPGSSRTRDTTCSRCWRSSPRSRCRSTV